MAKTAKKTTGKKITAKKVAAPAKKVSKKTVSAKVAKPISKAISAKVAKTAKKAVKATLKISTKAPASKKSKVKVPVKSKSAPKAPASSAAIKAVKLEVAKSPGRILADAAIHGILEKKGKNVICMDLKNVPNAVCDYFIICEAESTRQVSAIADSVDYEVKKATGENPFHTEGWENSLWILLDYVNVVVHVFESETRHFYRLESLWADAETKEYGVEYA
jgi:ribosome-associated protein